MLKATFSLSLFRRIPSMVTRVWWYEMTVYIPPFWRAGPAGFEPAPGDPAQLFWDCNDNERIYKLGQQHDKIYICGPNLGLEVGSKSSPTSPTWSLGSCRVKGVGWRVRGAGRKVQGARKNCTKIKCSCKGPKLDYPEFWPLVILCVPFNWYPPKFSNYRILC